MSNHRLGQLSDGIFAIVMTLLVFDVRLSEVVLPHSNISLWNALRGLVPELLTYALSFTLLFTYWRAHHFFATVYAKNVDLKLININLLFFMLVSLLPFSTSFLASYYLYEMAIAIFGIHIVLLGLTLYWMRKHVFYSESIKNPEITKHEILGSTVRTLVPVTFALIAIALAFVNIVASLVVFALAVLFNLSSTSTRMFEKIFKLS